MSPRDGYVLRPASNADFDRIWSLISEVLKDYSIVTDLSSTDRDLNDIEDHYRAPQGAFFVLLDGERIIGTAALCRHSEATCELCRMYLSRDYRRQGLGRRLLQRTIEEARQRGYRELRLETAASLIEAIALYRSVGFTMVDEAPTGGNCDLVMTRPL